MAPVPDYASIGVKIYVTSPPNQSITSLNTEGNCQEGLSMMRTDAAALGCKIARCGSANLVLKGGCRV